LYQPFYLSVENLEQLVIDLSLTPTEQSILKKFLQTRGSKAFIKPAEIFRKRGYYNESIRILEDGLRNYPDFHAGRVLLAKDYYSIGNISRAKYELWPIIDQLAGNLIALKTILRISFLEGSEENVRKAFDNLQTVFHFDEEDKKLYNLYIDGGIDKARQSIVSDFKEKRINLKLSGLLDADILSFNANEKEETFSNNGPKKNSYFDGFEVVSTNDVFTKWIKTIESMDPHPLDTPHLEEMTMAELYIQQGKYEKALEIYKTINNSDSTLGVQRKIKELKKKLTTSLYNNSIDNSKQANTSNSNIGSLRKNLIKKKTTFLKNLLTRIEKRT